MRETSSRSSTSPTRRRIWRAALSMASRIFSRGTRTSSPRVMIRWSDWMVRCRGVSGVLSSCEAMARNSSRARIAFSALWNSLAFSMARADRCASSSPSGTSSGNRSRLFSETHSVRVPRHLPPATSGNVASCASPAPSSRFTGHALGSCGVRANGRPEAIAAAMDACDSSAPGEAWSEARIPRSRRASACAAHTRGAPSPASRNHSNATSAMCGTGSRATVRPVVSRSSDAASWPLTCARNRWASASWARRRSRSR